jgi:uncharacterized protein (TIGR02217 family)
MPISASSSRAGHERHCRPDHLHHSPGCGRPVTADFEFDLPVRLDTDYMAVTIETFRLHRWQQIPVVELRI